MLPAVEGSEGGDCLSRLHREATPPQFQSSRYLFLRVAKEQTACPDYIGKLPRHSKSGLIYDILY